MKKTGIIRGQLLEYELMRKNIKNINLRVIAENGDAVLHVSAPKSVSQARIDEFLEKDFEWIENCRNKVRSKIAVEEEIRRQRHSDNPEVMIFGNKYLVITSVTGSFSYSLGAEGNLLILTLPRKDSNPETALNKALSELCELKVREICDKLYSVFEMKNVDFPVIGFKKLKSMWGYCKRNEKTLVFSKNLVHVPVECIECVVAHEFTHFLHSGHDKAFYDELDSVIPDRRKLEKLLKQYTVYSE